MPTRPRFASVVISAVMLASCTTDDSNVVRGKGLTVAQLSPADQAHVYEAAVRGAFDLDPSLSLLLDSRELPRGLGLSPEGAVPSAVGTELRQRGITRGSCEPSLATKGAPKCKAELPGYVLRFSPVFTLRGADSVQVYVYVQKYDVPGGEVSQTLRFERAYQVVRRGDEWRAVREGRVPKEIRGEPRS
ncbi:MAG: hypothetical protein ACREPM_24640 [Gemmatimonadaceae bacterium]